MSTTPPFPLSVLARRRTLALLGTVLALAIGTSVWVWSRWREPPPALPAINLTESDPEVRQVITRARDQVSAAPRSGPAWGRLGQVLRAHGFAVESNYCFDVAERFDPAQPRWPYLHGLTLVLTDPAAGIPCLERAVTRCDDNPPAPRLRLAEVLLEQGRLDEVEAHLRQAQRRDPEDPRILLGLGRLAFARGDWQTALDHLARCVDDVYSRKQARTLRADAHYRLGKAEQAREELKRAAQLPDDEPWPDPFVAEVEAMQVGVGVELTRASSLLHGGQPGAAVALLEDIVQRRPDSGVAWLRLGRTLLRLNDPERAEQALQEAVERTPDSVEAWFQLGCARFFLGRLGEAAGNFRRTLRLKPDHTLAHFNLGQCLKKSGASAEAAEEFRQALRCQPDYAPAREALGAMREK